MRKIQHNAAVLLDLGSASRATKGAVPGVRPDGGQPLQYVMSGLAAD